MKSSTAYENFNRNCATAGRMFTFLRHEIRDLFHAYRQSPQREKDVTLRSMAACHVFDEKSSNNFVIFMHLPSFYYLMRQTFGEIA